MHTFYLWFPSRKNEKHIFWTSPSSFPKWICTSAWTETYAFPIENNLLRPKKGTLLLHESKVLFTPKSFSPPPPTPRPSCSFQSKYIYFASGKMTSVGEKATLPAKEAILMVNRPELLRALVVAAKWDTWKLLERQHKMGTREIC